MGIRCVRPGRPALLTTLLVSAAVGLAAPSPAEAHITRIDITRVESPTFEGASFGEVGPYEKVVGRAFGEVDPRDPRNAVIADINLAPRNVRGMVEYSTDVYILRPVDSSKGNHRLFFEINNRGNNFSFGLLNNAPAAVVNDPTTAVDAGNGFLMRQGYTIILSGWDAGVAPGGGRQTITVPIARNPDGSSIVGPALEELVIDNSTTMTGLLTYAAATLDTFQASLSVRVHYADPSTPVPAADWEYVNASTIRLLPAGTPFKQGTLYEFTYPARDPIVAGLGFAATRDLAAYLRRAATNGAGYANSLAGDAQFVYSFCFSQPCRFLHDFLNMGFNEDERGERVFDGMLNWLGGGSGGFFNYRFAQPGRTHRQHIGRWYPERQFPFANQVLFDPITGKKDGRLRQCRATGTCPKIFEANSANEYWVKAGSLLHTDTRGNDLRDPRNVRFYLFSSLPHSAGIGPTGPGICQQPRNPVVANPGLRALLVALDEWVSEGKKPPASRVPLRANGTLVASLPQRDENEDRGHHHPHQDRHHQDGIGFPDIPGVTYNGLMTTGDLFDYGPFFDDGILTILPPVLVGSPYPAFVPRTDADGNDVAGVRLPEVAVPRATLTGWGLRAAAFGGDDLCDAAGQQIDFHQTKVERLAAGDPRLSIEERYPTHWRYVKEVTHAARRLGRERFLLDEDVQAYIEQAKASGIGK
jgi:Alpha/beta hydrolase domain